jgi:gag-polypeptide of LTR copia-type
MADPWDAFTVETVPFDGTGFEEWSVRFQAFLGLKGLAGALKPPTGPITDDMRNANEKAYALLVLSMEDKSLRLISVAKTHTFSTGGTADAPSVRTGDAADAWKRLLEKWGPDRRTLMDAFYRSKLWDLSEDPQQFVIEMQLLQEQLHAMGHHVSDEMLMFKVLTRLPEEYETVVDILLNDPDMTVTSMSERLTSKYSMLKWQGLIPERDTAQSPGRDPHRRFSGKCNRCRKRGHMARDCYA